MPISGSKLPLQTGDGTPRRRGSSPIFVEFVVFRIERSPRRKSVHEPKVDPKASRRAGLWTGSVWVLEVVRGCRPRGPRDKCVVSVRASALKLPITDKPSEPWRKTLAYAQEMADELNGKKRDQSSND